MWVMPIGVASVYLVYYGGRYVKKEDDIDSKIEMVVFSSVFLFK